MLISNLMGTSTATALDAVHGEKKKERQEKQGVIFSWQEDRVSLSDAALALAAQARDKAGDGEGEALAEEEKKTARSGSSPAAQGGSSPGDRVKELEGKIKELQQKMVQVQNSSLPEESKQALVGSLNAQISQVMQELNEIRMMAA